MKWIFEGRAYSSLEELSGKTMSEDNQPEPYFTENEVIDFIDHFISCEKRSDLLTPRAFFLKKY